MARKLFYLSLGFLCLAAAYQIGAYRGLAQDDEIPDVLRARALQIVDEEGNELVSLAATSDGEGMVSIFDGKGNTLVALHSTGGGKGAVATYDGQGNELVRLGATMGGEGAIATFDRAGEVQAQWP